MEKNMNDKWVDKMQARPVGVDPYMELQKQANKMRKALKMIAAKTYDNGFIPITLDEIFQINEALEKPTNHPHIK